MIIATTFNAMELDTEFVYLGRKYRKITKPNGKVGAMDLISQQVYPDCKHWTSCLAFIPDKKDAPNRKTFSVINSDGELLDIIALTPSQVRLLEWLGDNEYLSDDITISTTAPKKITEI